MLGTELQIAAVVHNDPLCKRRLRKWLVNLSATKHEPPGFVAVEWAQEIFQQIKQQRAFLHQMAKQEWPEAHPDLVSALSEAIGFEADTHKEVFPYVETLWLDEGRIVHDSTKLTKYAIDRMNIYKDLLPSNNSVLPPGSLEVMSKKAWERAEPSVQHCTDRDKKFASNILEALANGQIIWSIAIVGALHASDFPSTMRGLLEEKGVLCKVSVLKS